MRAGTGGVDALGAIAVDEAEDALGAAQPIEGTIAEQGVDEQRAGGADLGGARATPCGRLQVLGRAVGAPASDLEAPAQQMAIAVVYIAETYVKRLETSNDRWSSASRGS